MPPASRHTRKVASRPPLTMTGSRPAACPPPPRSPPGVAAQRLPDRGALGQPPHPHRAVAAEGCRLLSDLTVEDNLCLERLLPDARHCVGLGRRPGSLPTAGRRSPAAPSRRAPARLAASRAELRWEYPPAGGAQGSCTSAHDRGSLARRGSGSVYARGGCSYAHNSRRCTEPAEVPIITRVPDGVTLGLIMITGWQNGRSRSEARKGQSGHMSYSRVVLFRRKRRCPREPCDQTFVVQLRLHTSAKLSGVRSGLTWPFLKGCGQAVTRSHQIWPTRRGHGPVPH